MLYLTSLERYNVQPAAHSADPDSRFKIHELPAPVDNASTGQQVFDTRQVIISILEDNTLVDLSIVDDH